MVLADNFWCRFSVKRGSFGGSDGVFRGFPLEDAFGQSPHEELVARRRGGGARQ